jgi:phage gp36-like protein
MAYLSVPEYLARFGSRETGLFTNSAVAQGQSGPAYDADKVQSALDDATDEVEGYISRRYAVPLASPPSIVRGWVAAIARLKMAEVSQVGVSEAIQSAADRVTRQLEQLVAGKLDLPVPEGAPAVPENSTGAPITSGDRTPSLFSDGIGGFMAPFAGGYIESARWRSGR